MNIIRDATGHDARSLARIYLESFPDHIRSIVGQRVCESYFRAATAHHAYRVLAAKDDARVLGFVVFHLDHTANLGRGWFFRHPVLLMRFLATHPRRVVGGVHRAVCAKFSRGRRGVVRKAHPSHATDNTRPACARIDVIAVAADARGLGIGHKLLDACESLAREQNLDGITLTVEANNTAAWRLYERHGYHRIAHHPRSNSYYCSLRFDE